jgi:hypothetical protein
MAQGAKKKTRSASGPGLKANQKPRRPLAGKKAMEA